MTTYKEFIIEKNQIDSLIMKDYKITNIRETLDGAFVDFENQAETEKLITLHIMNADTRKYFATLLLSKR
ncbi:hypothetical protein [Gottfriedia luciferensis]|uniref:hypothetical protein n=1 Tax=Gottfriedia luciferensis TaxID=178774 RepID=UPI000B43CBCD|nr:hypothetical protein [Gottfriedia luciferensis]